MGLQFVLWSEEFGVYLPDLSMTIVATAVTPDAELESGCESAVDLAPSFEMDEFEALLQVSVLV